MWGPRTIHRPSPASEIIPGLLWVGGTADACDEAGLRAHGIKVKLNLRTTKLVPYEGIEQRWHPLVDWWGNTPEKFSAAVDELTKLMHEKTPTLVHCHMGVSRAPSVTATWWAQDQGMEFDKAVDVLKKFRPFIMPFSGVRSIARYCLGEVHASAVCVNCLEEIIFDRAHPYVDYTYDCQSCGYENTVKAFQYPNDSNS